jgi:hypothetical protein
MAIREVLVSFTFEQQRQMINLIGTDIGDASLLLTPTPVLVTAINEVITGDVDLSNQTIGMDDGTLASPSLFWDAGQGFYKVDSTKLALTSSLAITGDLEVDGDITFRAGSGSGGTLTFGDLDTDNIVFNADVQSSIVPDSSANYNLGSSNKQWNNLWIDGTASIYTLEVDENATVTGNLTVESGIVNVPNTQTTVDLFDDYATTVEVFGAGTSIRIGDVSGTLTVRNPTIVGTQTSLTLFNTVAEQVSAFGAAENITMGLSTFGGTGVNSNFNIRSDDTILDGDLNVNGGELLSQQNTFDLLINNSDVRIGASNGIGETVINNSLKVLENINLSNSGTNIAIKDNLTNSLTIKEGTNTYLQVQTTDSAERIILYKDLYVVGNLDISGTTTVIDTTNLEIKDKNITLADTAAPSDALADGGGITLKATTDKTIIYDNANSQWVSNIGFKFDGKVGIGTNPNKHLHIYSSTEDAEIRLQTNTGTEQNSYITLREATGDLDFYTVQTTANMKFHTANVERLRITPTGVLKFKSALVERCYVLGGTLSANPNINLELGNAYLFTTQETTTSTPNIRLSATNTLDGAMDNGEMISVVIMTTAAAAGYFTNITIDGNANGANGYTINTDWLGGSAPTTGGSAGIDVYSLTIIKQSASNFNVLISVNNYA